MEAGLGAKRGEVGRLVGWRAMRFGVVWCGVVWCGVVWVESGVVWCGVVWYVMSGDWR